MRRPTVTPSSALGEVAIKHERREDRRAVAEAGGREQRLAALAAVPRAVALAEQQPRHRDAHAAADARVVERHLDRREPAVAAQRRRLEQHVDRLAVATERRRL